MFCFWKLDALLIDFRLFLSMLEQLELEQDGKKDVLFLETLMHYSLILGCLYSLSKMLALNKVAYPGEMNVT